MDILLFIETSTTRNMDITCENVLCLQHVILVYTVIFAYAAHVTW